MSFPAPFLGILERLTARKVRFVLVGGLAVGAWGYVRGTEDVDLVPDPESGNLDRLIGVMEEIGGRPKVGDIVLDSNSVRILVRAGDKALILTELGKVDILQGLPQIPRYAELDAAAEDAELGGIRVRVCSLAHLLAMKRASDRPQDKVDLEALRTAHPEAFEDEEEKKH